ncbi:MAG: hypothetical protein Kow0037_25940 [Calditrichia bacterium]
MVEKLLSRLTSALAIQLVSGLLFLAAVLFLLPQNIVTQLLFFLSLLIVALVLWGKFGSGGEDTERPDAEELPEIEEQQQTWLQISAEQSVEEVFEGFLANTLALAKRVLVSDSVVLLLANYTKKQFNIRYKLTDKGNDFIQQSHFNIMKGLPSLVLRNKSALIENHLPQEGDLLPYYQMDKSAARSFMGVPVLFNDIVVGVLCADAGVEEAYSNDDLEILKGFGNLIAAQVLNSNKLYEYEARNWVGKTLYQFSREMNTLKTVEDLWDYLTRKVPKIFECDRVSIAGKISNETGMIYRLEGGTGNLKVGKQFALTEGIVGWVLRKNQALKVEDFSSKENYVPRYLADETPAHQYLSLLAVPISTGDEIIGALCIESYRRNAFSEQQKEMLQTIANQAAIIHYTVRMLDHLKQFSFREEETQLLNENAFRYLLPREISRVENAKEQLSLLFMKIYFQVKEDDPVIYQKTTEDFLSLVLPKVTKSDYIFRLYSDLFVVTSAQKNRDELEKWIQGLLDTVAQKKIWAEGQAFDFYVSIGVVKKSDLTEDVDALINSGIAAVQASRLKGPNKFAYFESEVLEEER